MGAGWGPEAESGRDIDLLPGAVNSPGLGLHWGAVCCPLKGPALPTPLAVTKLEGAQKIVDRVVAAVTLRIISYRAWGVICNVSKLLPPQPGTRTPAVQRVMCDSCSLNREAHCTGCHAPHMHCIVFAWPCI